MNHNHLTFNPGPSQLSPAMIEYIQQVATSGFLSVSHRSSAFIEVSRKAIEGVRERMSIPASYRIFYQPSATGAMDTVLRNLVRRESFHFVNGAFSSLFHSSAAEIGHKAISFESPMHGPVNWQEASIPAEAELIAVTHNETSTGVMWPQADLKHLRERHPTPLLAVDVTSSFGSMRMHWEQADIWLTSVQKCLGLPSGLGLLILAPRAFERAHGAKGVSAWQSLSAMDKRMQSYQTPETPNLVAIALLAKQMEHWDLAKIEAAHLVKAKKLYGAPVGWKAYVTDETWRSTTVPCFAVDDPERWIAKAKAAGIVLGKGYGTLVDSTLRIANFPAITEAHIEELIAALKP